MGRINGEAAIKRLEKLYNFRTAKALGQNFLTDAETLEAITAASMAGPKDLVIEIGPGLGVLTSCLAEAAGKVVAVEIDEKLIPILHDTLWDYPNVKIINQDILKVDLKKLIEEESIFENGEKAEHVMVVGNLPYYITTPIILGLLEAELPIDSITVMVQKEVADRMVAEPASKDYSVLTLSLNYYCKAEYIKFVGKENFLPQPKVDSAVVKLEVLPECPVEIKSKETYFKLVKAGFSQRRKTLSNSLVSAGIDKDKVSSSLRAAGIDPKRRAETLSLEEFAKLSNIVSD